MSEKTQEREAFEATAPDHIWLDCGEAIEFAEAGDSFRDLSEVTWSEDNATGYGIKYVRVSHLSDAQKKEVEAFEPGTDRTAMLIEEAGGLQVAANVFQGTREDFERLVRYIAPPAAAEAPAVSEKPATTVVYSTNGEDFTYDELGDALDSLEVGDTLYEGEAIHRAASHYFSVDWLLEDMGERAADEVGEWADNFPDVTKDEAKELAKIIGDWLDAKVPVRFWEVKNVKEFTVTKEMLDGTAAAKEE